MKVEALAAHEVTDDVLQVWQHEIGRELLPVQARAIEAGLFARKNLIVLAPTSSGKTFIGEMAATRAARADARVFYLVPLKSVAEEKFRDFTARYEALGLRVVVSTRDRREFDADIEDGKFHIAVVVYEKLQSLLVGQPELLDKIGLCVIDELQTIVDEDRGPGLEMLMTKLRMARTPPQIVGLSAVLRDAVPLATWLDAALVTERTRPVELRKGVLCGGRFAYREHNSDASGCEELGDIPARDDAEHLTASVLMLARQDPVLVFVPDRLQSRTLAGALARRLERPAPPELLEELRQIEGTGSSLLLETLAGGVAFHNADLAPEHRELIERAFRAGAIRVLVATGTLAMGVNLPVATVIIAERWRPSHSQQFDRWGKKDLSPSEFENMAGRAGRLGQGGQMGRAMLVTTSRWDQRVWMDVLVNGQHDRVEPTLSRRSLADVVLNLLASRLCRTEDDLMAFLLESFTGHLEWAALGKRPFKVRLGRAITELARDGMVRRVEDRIAVTAVGRVAASKGITVRGAKSLARWAAAARTADFTPLEVFYAASLTPEAQQSYVSLRTAEHRFGNYYQRMMRVVGELGTGDRPVFRWLADRSNELTYTNIKGLKKALVLHDWIRETKVEDLERDHQVGRGTVERLAADYAWLVEALAEIAEGQGWPPERVALLRETAQRLPAGIGADLVPLARVRVDRLGRTYLRRLAEAGITTPEQLRQADVEQLATALRHRGLAVKLSATLNAAAAVTVPESSAGEAPAPEVPDATAALPRIETRTGDACPVVHLDTFGAAEEAPLPALPDRPGKLVITARWSDRRCWITVDDTAVALTPKSYEIIVRMADARMRSPEGWTHKQNLGAPTEYEGWRGLSRLRRELRAALGDALASALLENDGAGSYRLGLLPEGITIEWPGIAKHGCRRVRDALGDLGTQARAQRP